MARDYTRSAELRSCLMLTYVVKRPRPSHDENVLSGEVLSRAAGRAVRKFSNCARARVTLGLALEKHSAGNGSDFNLQLATCSCGEDHFGILCSLLQARTCRQSAIKWVSSWSCPGRLFDRAHFIPGALFRAQCPSSRLHTPIILLAFALSFCMSRRSHIICISIECS
jgi:hypothetical protein